MPVPKKAGNFYKDNPVGCASGWYWSQKREAKYFSVYFSQALVAFFSTSNNEQGLFQTTLNTYWKKYLYLTWKVSQPVSDTSEYGAQVIPYLSTCSIDFIRTICRLLGTTNI